MDKEREWEGKRKEIGRKIKKNIKRKKKNIGKGSLDILQLQSNK